MPKLPIPEFEARIRVQLTPLGCVRLSRLYVVPIDDNRFGCWA